MYNNDRRPRYMGEVPGQNHTESQEGRENERCDERPQSATHSPGGYTVVTPNPQKRNQVIQQAQQGEEHYQRYKEQRKLGPVSCSGVLGGGDVSITDARRDSQSAQRRANMERRQREQERKEAEKRKEQEEFDRKKAEQRRKAEQNRAREQERQDRLHFQQRQNMEQHLVKLQGGNTGTHTTREPGRLSDMECEDRKEAQRSSPAVNNNVLQRRLAVLVRAFPRYDRAYLIDFLRQCNGSADTVIDMLE